VTIPRRILLINYEYPPLGGGGGNATRHIAHAFARMGHKPFVLTAAWDDLPMTAEHEGVTIHRIRAMRARADRATVREMVAFMAAAALAAPRLAKQWKIDACLVFFGLPCGPIGWLLKRTNGLPYVISLQGGDVPGFDPGFMANYHRMTGGIISYLWRDASAVIANSNGLAALARAHAPDRDIGVIPAGGDVIGITPKNDYAHGGEVRLLFVGRLVKQKGLDVLLTALAKVSSALKWRLVMAGDGPEWPMIAAQAARLALVDRIELHGWQGWNTLPATYRAADIFVLPSRDEGMPNALLEAMATGLPVIGTRIAGTQEAVLDGETGLLVPAEDADALADALTKLIADPTRWEPMGRAGRARVETYFSWNSVAEKWLDVIERAIQAKQSS